MKFCPEPESTGRHRPEVNSSRKHTEWKLVKRTRIISSHIKEKTYAIMWEMLMIIQAEFSISRHPLDVNQNQRTSTTIEEKWRELILHT